MHVAEQINQIVINVFPNHFLYLQLLGEPDPSILLADILDESVFAFNLVPKPGKLHLSRGTSDPLHLVWKCMHSAA